MRKAITLSAVLLMCFGLAGCHTLQKDDGDDVKRDWLGRKIEIVYSKPSKIVAIWSNTVFNHPGKAPTRGLGGRIYFYDAEHRPVHVDGGLSIYVYDDTDSHPGDRLKQEATRSFHFDADELKAKCDPTEFGVSYSIWLPWDDVGGDRKQLSVIPVFTDAGGTVVAGEQSRQLLPGKEPVEFLDENGNPVVQASYTTHSRESVKITQGELPQAKRETESSRILLPESMQRRLKTPPPKRKSWDIQKLGTRNRRFHQAQLDEAKELMKQFKGRAVESSAVEANSPTSQPTDTKPVALEVSDSDTQADLAQQLMKARQPIAATETIQNGLPAKRPKFKPLFGKETRQSTGFLGR